MTMKYLNQHRDWRNMTSHAPFDRAVKTGLMSGEWSHLRRDTGKRRGQA